jgi:purine-binding chemotaxis protein CheW
MSNFNDKTNQHHGIKFNELIPGDEAARALLSERMSRLAAVTQTDETAKDDSVNYIRFRLGANEYYGIPYADIEDIRQVSSITKVPMTPAYVSGVCYWHGKILPVIDLGLYFGITARTAQEQTKYQATISDGKLMMSLEFSDVIGVDSYLQSGLDEKLATTMRIKDELVVGIHAGTTTILHVHNLLKIISAELMKVRGIVS